MIDPAITGSEYKRRSALKSIIWRITGIFILALITFIYTRSWIQTGLVTVLHHAIFLLVYYFHERIWLKVSVGRPVTEALLKMFTYETLCGNIILGSITYFVTGNWKTMTLITLTYIGIKHIIYIFNEFIWKGVKWGKN